MDEQVDVVFPDWILGDQVASWQWLRDSKRDPQKWQVFRGETLLGPWDAVNRGEKVTLKPVPQA